MAQSHVQLPADSTGKNLATDTWTNSEPATVHGQNVVLYAADGTALATATSAPAGTEKGLIVRNVPSGTQTVSGTVDTELPAAAAMADSMANPTTPGVAAFPLIFNGVSWDRTYSAGNRGDGSAGSGQLPVCIYGWNGASFDRLRSDTTNGLDVDVTRLPGVAKGTQGATGVAVQDLKDSGRAAITITGYQVAGIITTEALFAASLVRAADGVTAAAAAQHTVTAGKRLRIQSVTVTVKNTAAAAGTSKLALRYRPAGGTVATTDSIVAILDIGSNNATANNYIGPYVMEIPDGFEMVPSATFGFTNLSSAVTMLHTITVQGFEY